MTRSGSGDDVSRAAMVLTVVDDRGVAERLAASAVEERLAACTQVEGPVRSVYRWKGEVCNDEEWRVVAKTTGAQAGDLVDHWAREHPYDVPEILVVPVTAGHEPYLRWMVSEVGSAPG